MGRHHERNIKPVSVPSPRLPIGLVLMSWRNLTDCLTVGSFEDITDIPYVYCTVQPYTIQRRDTCFTEIQLFPTEDAGLFLRSS
jgi:hypothetical protein